jgi:hypothetical protein
LIGCQFLSKDVDLSLLLAAENGKEEPVVMEFTHGTYGCANPALNQTAVPRGTNITFICDGSAGIGTLFSSLSTLFMQLK